MAIDPICGMKVKEAGALKASVKGQEYYFCSAHCRERFVSEQKDEKVIVCASRSKPRRFFQNRLFLISLVPLLLIALSCVFPVFISFRVIFLKYVQTIYVAVIAGLLLGGVIDYYVPREYIAKVLARKRPATIFNAVFLGFLMSACSHGILALAIQLHKKGASNPAVVSFLLASPWANITMTIMLIAFFGLKGMLIICSAIIIAIITGFIFMFLEKRNLIETNKNTVTLAADFSILKDIKDRSRNYRLSRKDVEGVAKGAWALGDMVLWWIVLGICIASLAGAYIPVHFFHKYMGPSLLGLVVTLGLATVIEVCSEGSSPLAFEIYRQTGALGNGFTFLMAGVVTDYTEIGLLWSNVGRRVAIWLPLVTVPQVLILGYFMNQLFK